MIELMDMVAWREDEGGRGYVDSAAAGASAMVGEGEGERQSSERGFCGVGAATWSSPKCPRERAASRWCGGELSHAGVTSLPA